MIVSRFFSDFGFLFLLVQLGVVLTGVVSEDSRWVDSSKKQILLPDMYHANRALHGDTVHVLLTGVDLVLPNDVCFLCIVCMCCLCSLVVLNVYCRNRNWQLLM